MSDQNEECSAKVPLQEETLSSDHGWKTAVMSNDFQWDKQPTLEQEEKSALVEESSSEEEKDESSSSEEKTVPIKEAESSSEEESSSTEEKPQAIPNFYFLAGIDIFPDILFQDKFLKLGCTYDGKYEKQVYFSCDTCFPLKSCDEGVCLGCANRCRQAGHDIDHETLHYGPFYCDFGHSEAGSPDLECDKSSDDESSDDEEKTVNKSSDEESPDDLTPLESQIEQKAFLCSIM